MPTPQPTQTQADHDRAEIKVKVIANGLLVKIASGWFAFDTWEKASAHIALEIKSLRMRL